MKLTDLRATYSSRHRSLHTQGESLPAFFYSWPFNSDLKRVNDRHHVATKLVQVT